VQTATTAALRLGCASTCRDCLGFSGSNSENKDAHQGRQTEPARTPIFTASEVRVSLGNASSPMNKHILKRSDMHRPEPRRHPQDLSPHGPLRCRRCGGLNGLLLIAWSASFTYLSMEKVWEEHHKER
jgi:hypothetical protein